MCDKIEPIVLTANNYQKLLPIADKQLELGLIHKIGEGEWNSLSKKVKAIFMNLLRSEKEHIRKASEYKHSINEYKKTVSRLEEKIANHENKLYVNRADNQRHLTKENVHNLFNPKAKKKENTANTISTSKMPTSKNESLIETEGDVVKKEYKSDLTLDPGLYIVKECVLGEWYKNNKFFVNLYCADRDTQYKVRAGENLTKKINEAMKKGNKQFKVKIEGSAYIKDKSKTKDLVLNW